MSPWIEAAFWSVVVANAAVTVFYTAVYVIKTKREKERG